MPPMVLGNKPFIAASGIQREGGQHLKVLTGSEILDCILRLQHATLVRGSMKFVSVALENGQCLLSYESASDLEWNEIRNQGGQGEGVEKIWYPESSHVHPASVLILLLRQGMSCEIALP